MTDRKVEWILCPHCKGKTRIQVLDETVLEKFPLFCPKCKRTYIVSVKDKKIREQEEVYH